MASPAAAPARFWGTWPPAPQPQLFPAGRGPLNPRTCWRSSRWGSPPAAASCCPRRCRGGSTPARRSPPRPSPASRPPPRSGSLHETGSLALGRRERPQLAGSRGVSARCPRSHTPLPASQVMGEISRAQFRGVRDAIEGPVSDTESTLGAHLGETESGWTPGWGLSVWRPPTGHPWVGPPGTRVKGHEEEGRRRGRGTPEPDGHLCRRGRGGNGTRPPRPSASLRPARRGSRPPGRARRRRSRRPPGGSSPGCSACPEGRRSRGAPAPGGGAGWGMGRLGRGHTPDKRWWRWGPATVLPPGSRSRRTLRPGPGQTRGAGRSARASPRDPEGPVGPRATPVGCSAGADAPACAPLRGGSAWFPCELCLPPRGP